MFQEIRTHSRARNNCHMFVLWVVAWHFSLVYGMEVVLHVEVEISSLRVFIELKLGEAEWVQAKYEQLNLVEEKNSPLFVIVNCTKKGWYEPTTERFIPDNFEKENWSWRRFSQSDQILMENGHQIRKVLL